MRRALLGIDGNCGFAGLGDLPTAPPHEWVFIEIADDPKDPENQERAATAAWKKLRENVAPETLTYALDESHPRAR